MELKPYPKTVAGWLGAACALAVVCLSMSPLIARAQTDAAASTTSPTTKTSATKAASATKPVTPSASRTRAVKGSKSSTTAAHNGKATRASSRKTSKKKIARGQQKIDSERAEAIQEALIREHYMTGEPAGTWNQASEDAMRRYQADHGWQSKTVPDSRALISLGLGPSHDHLLNPESAMTTGPEVSHGPSVTSSSLSQSPVSHGAEPGERITPSPAVPANNSTSGSSDPQ
ncbi:MAG: hypothetical protein WB762_31520 [Candidatus Sulfotelmatobacter sp.]